MLWSVIFIAVAGLVVYLINVRISMCTKRSKNPFFISRTPKKKLITDHKARNKVLKNVFSQEKIPSDLDAIVIGSGIGGLATAAVLSKAGKKVLVLEQHDQAGGGCHAFIEKGYEFDVGIHYVGKMEKTELDRAILDMLTDGQLDWAPMDKSFDVIQFGFDKDAARRYDVISGFDCWKEYLLKQFPSEETAIHKFFLEIRRCDQEHKKAISLKIFPLWISKLLIFTGLVNKITKYFELNQESTFDVIKKLTDNKELQYVMMYSFGDIGTLPHESGFPIQANLHNHFDKGGFYPVGGPSEIAFNIIPVIERSGGAVLVRARVTEILVDKTTGVAEGVKVLSKKAHIDNHQMELRAPIVISDAGIYNTFQQLLKKPVSRRTYFNEITHSLSPGPSSITVFIGLDIDDSELDAKSQNIWGFSGTNSVKLLEDYCKLSKEEVPDVEVPLVFVSFPSKKDPTWAARYPGKSTLVIIASCNYEWFKTWEDSTHRKRGDDYVALKNAIGYRMLAQVQRMFPQIKDKVDFIEIGSPLSNSFYLNATEGAMYGLNHTMNRFQAPMMAALRPETDITGLYLTGQDMLYSGLVGGMWSGVITSSIILGRQLTFMTEIETMWKSEINCIQT